MSQIKRICLYGGPGCGKSTTAAGVFHQLKVRGYNVEHVPEYIKDWAYEGRVPKSFQQNYIFAKQMNREDVLFPHVDLIVTDSPLLMNTVYSKKYNFEGWSLLVQMAMLWEKHFPGLHLFLDRKNIAYRQEGRYQDEDGAHEMDRLIREMLDEHLDYDCVDAYDLDAIVDHVVARLEDSGVNPS